MKKTFAKKASVSIAALSAPLAAPFAMTASSAWAEQDASWSLLEQIEIEEIVTDTSYEVRKIFPSAIENGVDQFDISGYIVPLYDDENIKEFILVSDMGFCPFCGDPDHGVSLQVNMAEALPSFVEGERVTLRGALETVTDPETWQTTILTGARIL